MKRYVFGLLGLFMIPVSANANYILYDTPEKVIRTSFGVVAVAYKSKDHTDSYLTFKGKAVVPAVESASFLALDKPVKLSNGKLAILVTNYGGNQCIIANHYWIVVGEDGYTLSPGFTTCSMFYKVEVQDNKLVVTKPGFGGPGVSRTEQEKALKERHVFVYENDILTRSEHTAKKEWPVPGWDVSTQ